MRNFEMLNCKIENTIMFSKIPKLGNILPQFEPEKRKLLTQDFNYTDILRSANNFKASAFFYSLFEC